MRLNITKTLGDQTIGVGGVPAGDASAVVAAAEATHRLAERMRAEDAARRGAALVHAAGTVVRVVVDESNAADPLAGKDLTLSQAFYDGDVCAVAVADGRQYAMAAGRFTLA